MRTNIHRNAERGRGEHGWLRSAFSFSFADYFNRNRMGFGALRVVNDDIIAPASGFPMHPHDNMEIVTIVTEGAVEHKDSMGNGSVVKAGEVQRMSAGSGILHSEWNPSNTETLRLYQIWIKTRDRDVKPEYEQASFDVHGRKGELVTLVSGEEGDGGLTFHQDAWMLRGVLNAGQTVTYDMKNREDGLFVFVSEGSVRINGETLERRDDMEIAEADSVDIEALTETDIILIEVPL